MRKLEWGETPWDDMPREQLLREVQRMYAALLAARSPLAMWKLRDPESPFWSIHGTGGRALSMADQALAPYPNEPAYRSFFRYAVDLLFEGVGSNWMICEGCLGMVGNHLDRPTSCCLPRCEKADPKPVFRKICWDDLKRTQGVER